MKRNTFLLTCCTLMATALFFSAQSSEPTAASTSFTSKDSVVVKAWDLVKSGKVKEAEALLASKITKGKPDAIRARKEAIDIIHRIRVEYALDFDGLVAKVKKSVPD